MKKSDEFIKESVFRTNLKFLKLQNETKELYFECLNEGKNEEYFNKRLEEIWGKEDYSFMEREIKEYREIIHENNMQILELEEAAIEPQTEEQKKEKSFFKTATKTVVAGYVAKLVLQKKKEYKRSLKSEAYKKNKQEYLKMKVERYDSDIVPYFKKHTHKIMRHVPLNTYVSMIHNTNLTREGWGQTLFDANKYGHQLFYIPYHNFSCSDCREHQGKIMTKRQVEDMIGVIADDEVSGDILHPNCKCTLQLYTRYTDIMPPKYSEELNDEYYHIRQKINGLTLEKERILSDIKIQEKLGNQDKVDELKQTVEHINQNIKDLKYELPTKELQRQVVAINRNYTKKIYE